MPLVTMPKDHPAAEGLTVNGETVKPGETVEVDDVLAAGLEDQGWKRAKPAGKSKAAPVAETNAAVAAEPKE